jgi:hypothetical protein
VWPGTADYAFGSNPPYGLVPVKTSQPDAIAGELKTVFASERVTRIGL